jgi:hypothetical protein
MYDIFNSGPTLEECKSVADADIEFWRNIAKNVGRWGDHETISQRGIRILKPDHRFSGTRGYVYEHRLIYEEYYKCCLLSWTRIYHINRNNQDNRIENLEARIRILCGPDHKCIRCGKQKTRIKNGKKYWLWGMCSNCGMQEYHLKYDVKSDNKCIKCGVQTRIGKNGMVRELCTYCTYPRKGKLRRQIV